MPPGEPVDRAIGPDVRVVTAAEVLAHPVQLRGVVQGCALSFEQASDRVTQSEKLAEFSGLAARYLAWHGMPARDLGEGTVAMRIEIPLGSLGRRGSGKDHGDFAWFRPGRSGPGESPGAGLNGESFQGPGQGEAGVPGRRDDQVIGPVRAVGGAHLAEHMVWPTEEVLVDRDLGTV